MNHSFNVDVANLFGVEGAVIVENLFFWISKNAANGKHFYEGDYWTYNSVQAFTELFPYWTHRQLERILKNLEKNGAIKTGNFNQKGYDRTKWYGITQTVKSIYANGEMHSRDWLNANTQTVKPIPDINSDINTNIKTDNIYTVVYNHYLTKTNLIKHKELTNPMKKAIDKSIKEYKLDQEYLLKIINRHSQKVELTKDNGKYAKKPRTLSQLFGQKIKDSVDLICSEYLDENWKEETKEVKQVNEFKGCKTDDIIARFGG